jgi:hypothetical protein
MKRFNVGILYLGLHNQLFKKFGCDAEITIKEFYTKLGKHGQIPKNLRPVVLKEMELKGLIQRINRDKFKVVKLDINIEEDCHKLFEIANLINNSK